nr:MAG TPA: hypothetical protein [Caudoviricetes sp.]
MDRLPYLFLTLLKNISDIYYLGERCRITRYSTC